MFSGIRVSQVLAADFNGGRQNSDGGGPLLREVDRRPGLTARLTLCLTDPRTPARLVHDQKTMLARRIFSIAPGHEDLNDHDMPRDDPLRVALTEPSPATRDGDSSVAPLTSPPPHPILDDGRTYPTGFHTPSAKNPTSHGTLAPTGISRSWTRYVC